VIFDVANEMGVPCAVSHHFAQGGSGAVDLAHAVVAATERPSSYAPLYPTNLPLRDKIEIIARRVYGADGIDVSPLAAQQLDTFEKSGFGGFMVCIAKTHLSISSDPKLKGAPTGWRLPVREVRASVGAGFIYAICGDMRTMPGLGSHPAAESIDIDENGEIVGLY
jgi:formate--tetrahydrofolate ligase